MTRVVFVSAHYPPWTPGGSAESVRIQAEALVRAGHNCTVVTPLWGEAPREEERAGVRIVRVPTGLSLPHGPSLEPARTWFGIHRQLAKAIGQAAKGADVLHAQDRRVAPATMLAARRTGVPALLTHRDIGALCNLATCLLTHATVPADCGVQRLMARCIPDYRRTHDPNASPWKLVASYETEAIGRMLDARAFARVLFVSEALRRAYQGAGAFLDVPTAVVPSPVEEGPVSDSPPAIPPWVSFFGKDSPGKGHPQFAEAARLMLGIVFDRYVGLRPDEVAAVMRASHVVVVPSVAMDALPRVALEAQAQERPVVGFRRGGLPEIVQDGVTGVLVGTEDPASMTGQALAEGIERALADSERMGKAARPHVLARFGASVVTERLLAVYREVLDGSRQNAV